MDTNQTGRPNESVNKQRTQTQPSAPQKQGQGQKQGQRASENEDVQSFDSQDFSSSQQTASRTSGQNFASSEQSIGRKGQNFSGSSQDESNNSQLDFQGRIRQQWPNFSDQDIDDIDGDNTLLAGRLEKVYGYSKDRAEREYRNFMSPKRDSQDSIH